MALACETACERTNERTNEDWRETLRQLPPLVIYTRRARIKLQVACHQRSSAHRTNERRRDGNQSRGWPQETEREPFLYLEWSN